MMATWKRLTRKGGKPFYVNLDAAYLMEEFEENTKINFSGNEGDAHVLVQEKFAEIVLAITQMT